MKEKIKTWWASLTGWKKIGVAAVLSTAMAIFGLFAIFVPVWFYGASFDEVAQGLSIYINQVLSLEVNGWHAIIAFFVFQWFNVFKSLMIVGGIGAFLKLIWRKIRRR